MTAQIIDGKAIAARTREEIARDVESLKAQGVTPGLAVVLVGENPASQVYVRNKITACEKTGIVSFEHKLPADSPYEDVAATIMTLNNDPKVHGILLQLPLPEALADVQEDLVQMVAPEKDVDGLTVANAGKLFLGMDDGLVPCTPQGAMILIKEVEQDLSGKIALVIGRSNLFGKPMLRLLSQENCTPIEANSRTRDLPALCRQADILVAAVGRPEMVKGDWIKPGAIVIDVGINRPPPSIPPASGGDVRGGKLVGDVAFAEAFNVAGAITPVPGGVGPMTIACLLKNTVRAARQQHDTLNP